MASRAEHNPSTFSDEAEARRLAELTGRAESCLASDPPRARRLAEEARALALALGDDARLAQALHTLGGAWLAAREYAAAEAELSEATAAARRAGDAALLAHILRTRLRCAFLSTDYQAALEHGIQALHLCQQVGDPRHLALAHNDLGLVYGALSDYPAALEQLRAGLRLRREQGDSDLASLHNNIGNIYMELGESAQALDFFRAALDGFRAQQNGLGVGIALGNIGRALAELGEHAESLARFQESLSSYQQGGHSLYLPPALARVAAAHAALGDDAAARSHFRQSLDLVESGAPGEFSDEILLAAARFHLQRGEPRDAVTLLSRLLTLVPADEATRRASELHRVLAEAYEQLGETGRALRHFKEFHRIHEAVSDGSVTIRIRGLMLQFDVERARQQEEIYRLKNVELARANDELRSLHAQLEAQNLQLQRISVEDVLTGLHNRRYLDAQLEHEVGRSLRRDRPLTVAVCDVDHFKTINDRFSHALGDEVLRVLGQLFRTTVRQEDVVARYGGEEFVMVLPETDLDGAEVLAERLRTRVAAHPWRNIHPELRVTLSIGLAGLGAAQTPDELLAAADARLYEAKRSGRDRVRR